MTGTIVPERLEKLNDITPTHGSHKSLLDRMVDPRASTASRTDEEAAR